MDRELDAAFDALASQGVRAIESGRPDQLESLLDSLIEPIELALASLAEYGLKFDPRSAQDVFPFEWRALEKPLEVYDRLLEAACRTPDRDLVDAVVFWPYKVMRLAVERDDHFFFRRGLRSYTRMYYLATRDALGGATSDFVRGRSWRHLKEFGSFVLTPRMRDAPDDELKRLLPYATELLQVYADLLRAAIDAADVDYFTEASAGFRQAIDVTYIRPNIDPAVELALAGSGTSTIAQETAEVLVTISDLRDALWLALGAWIARQWRNGHLELSVAATMVQVVISTFSRDFRRMWQAYNSALLMRHGDVALSRWESMDQPEGEVFTISPEGTLSRFFVALSLIKAYPTTFESVRSIRNPAQAIWLQGLVNEAIADFKEHESEWVVVMGGRAELEDSSAGSISPSNGEQEARLRDLIGGAVAYEQDRQRRRIIEQPLGDDKVRDFKADFLEGWANSTALRWLFEQEGRVDLSRDATPRSSVLRIWTFVPKGYFVDDTSGTMYLGIGHNLGNAMGRGEEARIYAALRKGAARSRYRQGPLHQRVHRALQHMRNNGLTPGIIIAGGGWQVARYLDGSGLWLPDYAMQQTPGPSQAGMFDNVPVYNFYGDASDEILIVSFADNALRLIQHVSDEQSIFTTFWIHSFTEETARARLEEGRSSLPKEIRDLPEPEVVDYLLDKVELRMEEALSVDAGNTAARAVVAVSSEREGKLQEERRQRRMISDSTDGSVGTSGT